MKDGTQIGPTEISNIVEQYVKMSSWGTVTGGVAVPPKTCYSTFVLKQFTKWLSRWLPTTKKFFNLQP
jgi:hypothetical protein